VPRPAKIPENIDYDAPASETPCHTHTISWQTLTSPSTELP